MKRSNDILLEIYQNIREICRVLREICKFLKKSSLLLEVQQGGLVRDWIYSLNRLERRNYCFGAYTASMTFRLSKKTA